MCSFCDTKMEVSKREGIQISHCPHCGGIWLQRGALEGILARSLRAAPNERYSPDNQRSEDDDDDGVPVLGGRRGQNGGREERGSGIREFLGNLFDFG
jgi:Zn-finger nucleic acid-binding protein